MDVSRFDKKNFSPEQILGSGLVPDPYLNIQHNIKVLAETNYEADNREKVLDEKLDKVCGNIADILAHYAKHRLANGGTKKIDEYLGKAAMKQLYENRLMAKYASEGKYR